MSILAATILFFVHFPSSASSAACDTKAVGDKMMPCITLITTASGSTCDKWNTAVCCLKNEFSSCDASLSSTIDNTLDTMSSTLSSMMPDMKDLSGCPKSSCSGGSGGEGESSTPVAVEKAIETMIEFATTFDPTTFDLTEYLSVVASKTGGTAPAAIIKGWDVVLAYAVAEGTTDSQLKAAIATAMNIAENLITILTGGRRLTTLRRLAVDKQVSISASDATKAKQYKDISALATTTDSLTNTLGGAVTIKTQPVTKVKVETKVTSTKSKSELETELKSPTIATAVNGTISSVESSPGTNLESSGGFRSGIMVVTSIALAAVAGFV